MTHMVKLVLVTTAEYAQRLGVTRQAIVNRVNRGTLKPYRTLANGHHLFKLEPES